MRQLILQTSYFNAYNMKLPNIYEYYTIVILILGQTIMGIHLCLMIVNMTAIVLLYLVVHTLINVGVVAVASYNFFSVNPSASEGFNLCNTDH